LDSRQYNQRGRFFPRCITKPTLGWLIKRLICGLSSCVQLWTQLISRQ
jgi:hypothetical protein